MAFPDWSRVTWNVYESHAGVRVLPRELSGFDSPFQRELGELRPGEVLMEVVRGVSRATVLFLLKSGVRPGRLTAAVSRAADDQHARSAGDRRPSVYREWVAKLERDKRELTERRQAA